jgi:Zn-dependent M28 family amino/carboxypeptidase
MVMVGNEVANLLFESKGYDVQSLSALLRDGNHLSFPTGIRAGIHAMGTHHSDATTYNVVGMIEGSDPVLKEEYLIFGAHLDHLGPWPIIHPGASDNASGSTIVMELAYAFSRLSVKPKRSLLFALFGAEELGLLGSKYMTAHMPRYPTKPMMMVNIDVAGAGTDIRVTGGKTYPDLYNLIEKVNDKYTINPNISAGEISPVGGNSDYAPFLAKGIPAYTNSARGGQRFGIHTAGDSLYIVTPKIMEDIARLYFVASYLYANK